MSEKTYTHHQHEQDKPNHELENHSQEILDNLAEKGSEASRQHDEDKAERLDEMRNEIAQEALESDNVLHAHQEQERQDDSPTLVGRDLKDIKYKRTLQSVRKDLNAPEKVLSKIIHNPIVDTISEVAEKTIARPSGLLTGSIFAFIGSSTFLYVAKHYGYEYNFLLLALFFVGGFGLGLILELFIRMLKKSP